MIRFINIGNQAGYSKRPGSQSEFCFFDTVTDKFLEFDNEQIWWSYGAIQHSLLQDLEKDFISEDMYERVLGLIPEKLR